MITYIQLFITLGFVLILSSTEALGENIIYYVATDGNDAWSGKLMEPNRDRTDGPFASVAGAQRAIRKLKEKGDMRQPVNVLIRGGIYRLSEPIVFTPDDSGTEKCPITYMAYRGEKPILSGGRRITNWKRPDPNAHEGPARNLWTAQLPDVKAGRWYFRQLFIVGRRARRARMPNDGYFRVESLVNAKPGAHWNEGVDKFRFEDNDIKSWTNLSDVEVVVFHSWNTSRVRIASVDEENRIVTFTGPTIFRPRAWDTNQRYYVENVFEGLDSPGEWYLDRQRGTLYYWPLPGEDMTKAEVVAPVLKELLQFRGECKVGMFVKYIRVIGLSFQHADWTLPEKGYGDPQAAVTVPAVVSAQGALFCAVEQCEIAHVGTYGLWFGRGCKDNRIVQNHIHDLGAGGVRIGEAKMAKEDVAEASRNLVSNNYIHDGGHVYAAGVGIWVAQSSHNIISHNEVHSFDYSGMSIGWNWNTLPNRTHHNTIENNHIHHVMRGVLSDGAGIYTLGTQPGTVLRNNLIHDVFPYMGSPAMAWCIYLDQGSNGLLIENNICYNTLTGGMMNTARFGNVIRNNIFALSAWHAIWRMAYEEGPPTIFERNIIYLTQGELFHVDGGQSDFKTKWDYNLFWRTDGQPLLFYDYEFDEWQEKGLDRHSLIADPLFDDVSHYNFRLKPESPAFKLGFKQIDMSENGLYGQPEWVNLPKRAKFAPTKLPPAPPPPKPTPVDDGFEDTPIGAQPKLAKVYVENRGDSVRVTDETAATGKHSLKFTDAPGLEHVWNPHIFYSPNFTSGILKLSFDMRVEKGAIIFVEWRDSAYPYHVGPSFQINTAGQLNVSNKPLMTIPFGRWFHVDIICGLGKDTTGKYSLTVTVPGKGPIRFPNLSCGSEKFKKLKWMGFVSSANDRAVFYLDNVKLESVKEGK